MDPKILDDIARQLAAAVPKDMQRIGDELQKSFHVVLEDVFQKLSLVTREEFDAQRSVLDRTREKLEALEQRLRDMEQAR